MTLTTASTKFLLLTCLIPFVFGCSSFRGAPEEPFSQDEVQAALTIKSVELSQFLEATTPADRNKFMRKSAALIDVRFQGFVSALNDQRNGFDVAYDIAEIGLGIAGTLVGSSNSKTNLAAASAFLSGGQATVDRVYFFEKTIPALVEAMKAARTAQFVKIKEGMNQPVDTYSAADAARDLLEYYRAGTILGAVQYVQTKAAAETEQSEEKIKSIVSLTEVELDLKKKLTGALSSGNTNSNDTKLRAVLTALSQPVPASATTLELRRLVQAVIRDADVATLNRLDQEFKAQTLYSP